ncbi:hypothetical protein E4A48_17395 [Xanthomonas cerealis pv. cerealis]|uniref:Uncharacterized protein n=1 Tax=Xanthomonas cerealis pv. cerealis TaxID=152263 RepID=A0A514EGP9_9XANT|nr:hypothetical protein E4A48_17395 [Xanthomonas translucens pv. cerealis]
MLSRDCAQSAASPSPSPSPSALLLLLLWLLLLTCRVPFRSGGLTGEKPERGGAHGCAPFAAGAGCPFRESPVHPRTRSAQRGGREAGRAFFWLLFFARAKKSDPPRAEAFALLLFFCLSVCFCRSGFSRDWFCQESVAAEAAPTLTPPEQEQNFRLRRVTFLCLCKEK